jgi:hypothetical protein
MSELVVNYVNRSTQCSKCKEDIGELVVYCRICGHKYCWPCEFIENHLDWWKKSHRGGYKCIQCCDSQLRRAMYSNNKVT